MKRSHFIVLCTLVVVALTQAVRISLNDQDNAARSPATVSRKDSPEAKNPRRTQPRPLNLQSGSRNSPTRGGLDVRPGDETPTGDSAGADSAEARAKRVEAHARERLERLTSSLHLSGDQQRRIFPILARGAPDFDPSMIIGGVVGGYSERPSHGGLNSVSDQAGMDESMAVYQELDPDQQAVFEEALIDDGLWWAEILSQIEIGLSKETSRPATNEPEVVEDPGAGDSLFDLLGQ